MTNFQIADFTGNDAMWEILL